MSDQNESERQLVERIRSGDARSWEQLIAKYEGRLLAFAHSRLGRRSLAEDVVQEAFVGFLTSLPNFDARRRLEGYLFSICAHKLTDHMRREGRRPALPFSAAAGSQGESLHLPASGRGPSTIVRSGERQSMEAEAVAEALAAIIARWKQRGDWNKLKCIELLMVRGKPNKEVAERLGLSEQQVANFKHDFLVSLRKAVRAQDLSPDVFPELHA